jgi:hypothetical protein
VDEMSGESLMKRSRIALLKPLSVPLRMKERGDGTNVYCGVCEIITASIGQMEAERSDVGIKETSTKKVNGRRVTVRRIDGGNDIYRWRERS